MCDKPESQAKNKKSVHNLEKERDHAWWQLDKMQQQLKHQVTDSLINLCQMLCFKRKLSYTKWPILVVILEYGLLFSAGKGSQDWLVGERPLCGKLALDTQLTDN